MFALAIESASDIFPEATAIMTGYVGMGIDFVKALLENPVGKIVILLPIGIKAGNWVLRKIKGR